MRSVLVSPLVLRGQAQARSTEASSKGFHIGATRTRPARRQDGGHHGAQGGVTPRAFCKRRLLLSGKAVLVVPFQMGRCWLPSRSIFEERTRASINRTSHHSRRHLILSNPHPHKFAKHKNTSSSGGCSSPCTVHHQPKRQSTTTLE